MSEGLEALEKAKDIIFDYSSAYMNLNVPESEIYGSKKGNAYKEYDEKNNDLYKQLGIMPEVFNVDIVDGPTKENNYHI